MEHLFGNTGSSSSRCIVDKALAVKLCRPAMELSIHRDWSLVDSVSCTLPLPKAAKGRREPGIFPEPTSASHSRFLGFAHATWSSKDNSNNKNRTMRWKEQLTDRLYTRLLHFCACCGCRSDAYIYPRKGNPICRRKGD
jgi:hypothetical protein